MYNKRLVAFASLARMRRLAVGAHSLCVSCT